MEISDTSYLIRLKHSNKDSPLYWCCTLEELELMYLNFPYVPGENNLELDLSTNNLEEAIRLKEIIVYKNKNCSEIALLTKEEKRNILHEPYQRDKKLFEDEGLFSNPDTEYQHFEDFFNDLKLNKKNREFLESKKSLAKDLAIMGMNSSEIINLILKQINIKDPTDLKIPEIPFSTNSTQPGFNEDVLNPEYQKLLKFLNNQGHLDYDPDLLDSLHKFADLGMKFEDLLNINFNENLPYRKLNSTDEFKQSYINALKEQTEKYKKLVYSLLGKSIQPFVHEVFYNILSGVNMKETDMQNFSRGVLCEIIAEEFCPSPDNSHRLQGEHLQYRGDLVCLECEDVDIDVKSSKNGAIKHCKNFTNSYKKAVHTRYSIYFEIVNDNYCLRLKDCSTKSDDLILYNTGTGYIWMNYSIPIQAECFIIPTSDFDNYCDELFHILKDIQESYDQNISLTNPINYKDKKEQEYENSDKGKVKVQRQTILDSKKRIKISRQYKEGKGFMEREVERRNKLKAINKKSIKIQQIKEKIRQGSLKKGDPDYNTAIELDLINQVKMEKQKQNQQELNDLVDFIEEDGNKTHNSGKKQSGSKKKKKKK